jgi:hypothetical protein
VAERPPKPTYVRAGKVIDDIREIAREHGSLRAERDIDLIAAPWTRGAHGYWTLIRAVAKLPYLSRVKAHDKDRPKPHGRRGSVFLILHRGKDCPAYVDLSVMPRGRDAVRA